MTRRNRVITGYHAIEEHLRSGASGRLFVTAEARSGNRRVRAIVEAAEGAGLHVQDVRATDELARAAGLNPSQASEARGVVLIEEAQTSRENVSHTYASVREFVASLEVADRDRNLLVLLLDGVTDPQNLGAVLRSADQFAVSLVVTPERRSAGGADTVARISSGASAFVPRVEVKNLSAAIAELKDSGFWIYGADMAGSTAPTCDLRGRVALVMGSEGKGLSRLVRERCDVLVSIPTRGHIDSLNISVAAGILMYEIRRQQWDI